MAKLILDKNNMVSFPTLLLQNKNFDTLGCIADYYDFTYSEHFNGANECSFTVYKKLDNVENALWDSIVDFKVLYIPEYQERFEIKVSESYEGSDTKNITATSLCEAELGQTILRNIEINTEADISNVNYDENFPTVFFRNVDDYMAYDWSGSKYSDYSDKKKQEVLRNSSLLHRLLEKAPHYSIGHIDQSLMNLQRTFSISNTDIYGELTGEIAEEFGCLFVFDSMTRTISAYDLYYTCATCGHRGDFSDKCSKCGSEDLYGQYGEDTTVFIDRENLANNISIETNSDSLKNCFYVEGGDELVNATIRMINPNGSQYIFYFSEETKKDMPAELVNILEQYEDEYSSIINDMNIALTSDISIINNYNIVVNCINTLFPEKKYDEITQFLVGYSSISKFIFEATDLYMFVKTSMMPTIEIDNMDIKSSMLNIVNGFATGFNVDLGTRSEYIFQNTIAITNPTSAIQSIVERRVLNTAKLYYNTALYNLDLECINYTKATTETDGSYTCKFILTSIADKDDNGLPLEEISEEITLSISDDVLLYTEQEIIVATADKDSIKDNQITSLSMPLDKFTERIKLYSLDELSNLLTMFESCLSIIEDKELKDNELYMIDDLYGKYRSFYYDRILIVNQRLAKLEEYLGYIKNVYYYDSSNGETSGVLNNIRNVICDMLDIKSYLGDDLYNTFCSYRREDTYSNSNYISDGLNDAELLEKTEKLLDVAKKELYKAGSLQYSVSSDINNFLALPEFEPFKSKFEVGNWIRIGIDDKIYKLRLLSYEVKYEDVQTISLEFSTVEKIYNGTTDINSIMSSASSMATSYSSVTKQVEKDSEKVSILDNWVNDGLMATHTKFANAKNQSLIIDENGLLARSYDSIYNTYSPYQLKILNNGLYTTHDAWKTIDTGVGRISYYDPLLGKYVDDYGVIAKTLVGHLIIGENLVIANSTSDGKCTVKIDQNGITLDGGSIQWSSTLPQKSVSGLSDSLTKLETDTLKALGDARQGIEEAAKGISLANAAQTTATNANNRAENAETNAKKYADTKYTSLSATLKSGYEAYANSKVKELDDKVTDYLGWDGTTIIDDKYVISPYIGGGYLNITSDNKRVIIDPKNLGGTNYIFQVHNGNEISVGIKADGTTIIDAEIHAKKLTLGAGVTIPSNNIDGIDSYATKSSLSSYATTGELQNYLRTNDLNAKLGDLHVSYRGDVTTTQTKNETTGIITTISTYIGSDGKTYTNTTYTTEDSNYVLLNRTNEWNGNDGSIVKISKDGLLEANNAIITGTIYATDGEFTGAIKGGTININNKFKVDEYGNVTLPSGTSISWNDVNGAPTILNANNVTTITKNTVSSEYIKGLNLEVGNQIKMGANAQISWNNVTNQPTIATKTSQLVNDSGYETASSIKSTVITKDYIETLNIKAGSVAAENIIGTTISGKTISGGNIINEKNGYVAEIKDGQIHTHVLNLKNPPEGTGLAPAIYLEAENGSKLNSILFKEDLIKFGSAIECGEITSSSSVWIKESFHVEGDDNGLQSGHGWLIRNNTASNKTVVAVGSTKLDTRIYGTNIYQGGSSTTITSDKRIKEDFNTLEQYEDLFFCLKPVSYKYKNGTSGRTHIGIVGQDVKEALHNNNLTTDDFAGYVEFPTDEECMPYVQDNTMCGVRLNEFVMLNTHMIQKLYKVIENQKQEIDLLKEKLEGMS